MRRYEKEITDPKEIEEIINCAKVCRVAMCEDDHPYVVPFSFGYKDNTLYFHSAREGMKVDILRKNPNVCFEMDIGYEIEKTDTACSWNNKYRSVISFGVASFVEDREEKIKALDILLSHYSDKAYEYTDQSLDEVLIIKIDIERKSGKKSE